MQIARLAGALALVFACHVVAAPEEPVMLNFVNADIETVVQAIGQISGKNFVLDPRVKGTINIVSARPVPRSLSYQVLLSSLRMQGFTAVESDGVVKILPEADAKLHARVGTPRRNDGDRLITKVFILKNGSANQMVPVLRPIISPNNTVSAMPGANALIITDYADNIRRAESIIESVEQAAAGDTVVLPVQFGSAAELGGMLSKLLQEGGQDGGRTTIIPDPRANVLLVRADTPGKIGKVKALLKMLDQPSQAGSNVRVVYLKNAEASKVAPMLRLLLTGEASGGGGSSGGYNSNQYGSSTPSGGTPTAATSSSSPGSGSSGSSMGGNEPSTKASGQQEQLVGGPGAMVQADSANNALILNVPDSMYRNLRNVIDLLDRRRAQVFMEALIVEVSAKRLTEIGVQWSAMNGNVFAGTNFPNSGAGIVQPLISGLGGTANATATGLEGLVKKGGFMAGVINTVTIGGKEILSLGALAQALETEADGNVLSQPQLMTLDNEEAKIVVGQNVPFLTGSYSNTGGGSTPSSPFQTYERKDVGLTLKVTPQISEGGLIKLRIYQESSSVDPTTKDTDKAVTNKRTIETSVIVRDGNLIALGGLIQDQTSDNADKVPFLGDLPLIGALFRYQKKERNKTNLMVFLRPTILRDDDGAAAIAGERYDYIMGEHARRGEGGKLSLDPKQVLQQPSTELSLKNELDAKRKALPR